VKNNLHIELYHQLGHIAITNPKDTYKAKQSFIKFNRLNEDVDDELINTISYFNNMVDQNTRRVLQDYVDHINAAEDYGYSIKQDAYTFRYMPNFDTRNYYKLIH
jgi:oligoribonuclease (3'-5' exoribonuclease)